jgi:hypothetical protein
MCIQNIQKLVWKGRIIFKTELKEVGCGLDSCGSGCRSVVDFREHGNEH